MKHIKIDTQGINIFFSHINLDTPLKVKNFQKRETPSNFCFSKNSYEYSNHLGNVLEVISDRKLQMSDDGIAVDYYVADVVAQSDYYPFGMLLLNTNFYIDEETGVEVELTNGDYRYKFNGKEDDPETYGNGNVYDYGFRIYNPRLGKFLSMDPLCASFPWYTPYQFAGNKPIVAIDLDGKEEYIMISWTDNNGLKGFTFIRVPIDKYIKEKTREIDNQIKSFNRDIDAEKANMNSGLYSRSEMKAGRDYVEGMEGNIAILQADKQQVIEAVEANYSGKILHVEKGGASYMGGHVSTKAEADLILQNPVGYVENAVVNGSEITTEFTDREKLILNEGAPAIDVIENTTHTQKFNEGSYGLVGDVPLSLNPTFNSASAVLDEAGKDGLYNLYLVMTLIPDLKIELVGHTDNEGSPGSNQDLSENRAAASKEYLVSLGIEEGRVTTSGQGDTSPIGDNNTVEGKAENRRIEIIQR